LRTVASPRPDAPPVTMAITLEKSISFSPFGYVFI